MSRLKQVFLVGALTITPLGTEAADLVVWWEEGIYAQEDLITDPSLPKGLPAPLSHTNPRPDPQVQPLLDRLT